MSDDILERLRRQCTQLGDTELYESAVDEIERLRVAEVILRKLVIDEFIEVDAGTAFIYQGRYTAFDESEFAFLAALITETEGEQK